MNKSMILLKSKYMTIAALALALYGCQKDRMSYANYTPTETSPFITRYGATAPTVLNVSGKWKCVSFIRKEYDDEAMTTPTNPTSYNLTNSFTYWDFSVGSDVVTIKRVIGTNYGASVYTYGAKEDNTLIIRSYTNTNNKLYPDVVYKTVDIGTNNVQFTTVKPYKFISSDPDQPNKVIYAYDTFQLVRDQTTVTSTTTP